jgi:hypothetical protein
LRVRDAGPYFLLYLSRAKAPAGATRVDRQVLAELGRYVDRPNELLAENAFQWRSLDVQRDLTLNITF